FFEYFRPQSIYPSFDVLPWTKLFLLGAIALGFTDKKAKIAWSWTHTWILLFTIQIHISFLFAYYPSWSEMNHINFFQWVIIYLSITMIVTTKERFYVFLLVFFLCSLKIAIGTSWIFLSRGLSFTGWGLKGPPGFFENSGELAIQMVILFSLTIYFIVSVWKYSGRLEKVFLLIALVSPALTVMGASSRGSQIAIFIVLLCYFHIRIFKPKILVAAFGFGLTLFALIPEEQMGRFQTIGEDRTSEQRILYWTNGLEMIRKHPLTGVGYYNFIPYYSNEYPEDVLFVNSAGQTVAELPHNILIQVGTDAGIPAIAFYLLIMFSLKKKISRYIDPVLINIHKGLLLGVVGFFIAGQFVTVGYYPFLWISAALISSLANSMNSKLSHSTRNKVIEASR
ncbi:O-antigen ligase family protein, partial [Saccharospirillum alexandrii]|uniref:O-antigen ligase family protein n=1 Tax=Saccharospirillum alexandrii TaxID=2448477 RepID=UPI001C70A52A